MALAYRPSQEGVVGVWVNGTDNNGQPKKLLVEAVILTDQNGNPVTPGGGGAVTIADGADVALGAKADAAYTTGAGSVVSLLKGLFGKLPTLGAKAGTGSVSIVPATDARFSVGNRAIFWQETDAPLAAAGTFNGASRDVGAASPGPVQYAYFTAMVLADQTGTATIQRSADGTTWVDAASGAIAANTPLTLQIPVTARYHRVVVENGGTAQTALSVSSSYTAT